MNRPTDIREKYRLSGRSILFCLMPILFVLPGAFVVVMGILLNIDMLNSAKFRNLGLLFLVCSGPVLFLILMAVMYQIVSSVGSALFSHFEISSSGLTYRYWPSYGIRCKWEDIESLGRRRELGLINNDVLYVKEAEYFGWHWPIRLREKLGIKTPRFIPLSGIAGWPKGRLADELTSRLPGIIREL